MEYKNLREIASKAGKFASIAVVASLPYICDSCAYDGNKANAAEIRIEKCHTTPDSNNLEAVLNLR